MPMGSLIDDEILEAFAVVAPVDTVASKIRDRCDGVIDRVLVGFPSSVSERTVTAVLTRVARSTDRVSEEVLMSTPTMDEAAKVLADPKGYADEPGLHTGHSRTCGRTPRCRGSTCRDIGPSGPSPNTPTSWRSSASTSGSRTHLVRCWGPPTRRRNRPRGG